MSDEAWLDERCRCGRHNRDHMERKGTLNGRPLMAYYPCFTVTQEILNASRAGPEDFIQIRAPGPQSEEEE